MSILFFNSSSHIKKSTYFIFFNIKGIYIRTCILLSKFICTYSIRDDGKKVLLNRIPVKDDNTDMVSNKSSKSHSLFNLENSKFCNEAIISTTRASFEFNQKSLKEKYHEKDLKDIMDILTKSI